MSTYNIIVVNVSGVNLFVTGSYGSDLGGLTPNQPVPSGQATTVATWDSGSGPVDNWDYIYLGEQSGGPNQYQLYMESTSGGTMYQLMGFYSPNPNNSNSNPLPFNNGGCYCTTNPPSANYLVADGNGSWVYVLLTRPS